MQLQRNQKIDYQIQNIILNIILHHKLAYLSTNSYMEQACDADCLSLSINLTLWLRSFCYPSLGTELIFCKPSPMFTWHGLSFQCILFGMDFFLCYSFFGQFIGQAYQNMRINRVNLLAKRASRTRFLGRFIDQLQPKG